MTEIPESYKGAALAKVWTYHAPEGAALAKVARYDHRDGKEVIPFRPNGQGWKMGAPPEPRPLFALDRLAADPGAAVFLVEGEKTAAAALSLGIAGTTWQGGSKATGKTDWQGLSGRKAVYLLPDNDGPGTEAMKAAALQLATLEDPPAALWLVQLPALPKAGDLCDWIAARVPGWNQLDPVPEEHREALRDELRAAITEHRREIPPEWLDTDPEITPLPAPGDIEQGPAYPLVHLPGAARKAAEEITRFVRVPGASPAVVALAVLAVAIGKRARIAERPGLYHWPALFFAIIAGSGERKSPVFKSLMAPLEDWAEAQSEQWKKQQSKAKAKNEALDSAIAGLKQRGRKEGADVEAIAEEIQALDQQRVILPASPSLFTTDTTEERLFQKMSERDGAYSVLSGEGRPVVDSISGKYSGGAGRTGDAIYLAGISGDTITRDRVGGEAGPEERAIRNPCLNVCIMLQPDKYLEAAGNPSLRASGALARIWPVLLPSLVGERLEGENEGGLNAAALEPFRQLVTRILDHAPEPGEEAPAPHLARLSPEAAQQRREFHNAIETMMREGGDLEDVRDIASKAVSQTAKLALILHLAEAPELLQQTESTISAATWGKAQAIGTYHLTEAVRVQHQGDEDPALEAARRLVAWIKRERLLTITAREVSQKGPRPRSNATDAAHLLELLSDHGYLIRQPPPTGKQKPVFRVNRKLVAVVAVVAKGEGGK